MKKLTALLLALTLVMSMGTTAFASNYIESLPKGGDVTGTNKASFEYTASQEPSGGWLPAYYNTFFSDTFGVKSTRTQHLNIAGTNMMSAYQSGEYEIEMVSTDARIEMQYVDSGEYEDMYQAASWYYVMINGELVKASNATRANSPLLEGAKVYDKSMSTGHNYDMAQVTFSANTDVEITVKGSNKTYKPTDSEVYVIFWYKHIPRGSAPATVDDFFKYDHTRVMQFTNGTGSTDTGSNDTGSNDNTTDTGSVTTPSTPTERPTIERVAPKHFPDVHDAGHWSAKFVDYLTSIKASSGYPDGTFKPDKSVGKAEFIKMAYTTAIGGDNVTGAAGTHWATKYMEAAKADGIINFTEYPQSEWDKPITRKEMAKIITLLQDVIIKEKVVSTEGIEKVMADHSKLDPNYAYFIESAYARGIITGVDTKGTFAGEATGTRGQAATLICRMMETEYRKVPQFSADLPEGVVVDGDTGELVVVDEVTNEPAGEVTPSGTVIEHDQVTRMTVFRAGDTFITPSGDKVVLQAGPSGVVGEGQGLNLYADYIAPDGSHLENDEMSSLEAYFGQTYMIDQYGEGHHSKEWNKISQSELGRANAYVKEIKANGGTVAKGDTFGRWLVYGSFGWSWTGPVNQ